MLLRSGEFQSSSTEAKSSVPHGDEALGGDAQMGIGGTALTHQRTAELQKELTVCQI